jgi:uncharacterized protein YegL
VSLERVEERRDVAEGQLVMPFYIVCDVSFSMTHDMPQLNDALAGLRRAIVAEPAVDDVARIGVLTFSDTARVAADLGQLSEGSLPRLTEEGTTNYGEAFRVLARTIDADRQRLKAEGYRLYRPCAFFLTDGLPTDSDWERAFVDTLTYDPQTQQGMKSFPIFVPIGFRDADESVLKRLAFPPDRSRWFLARTNDVAEALAGIRNIILKTVVTSSNRANTGKAGALAIAEPDPGSAIMSGDSKWGPEELD